jgi:hypothetical protein
MRVNRRFQFTFCLYSDTNTHSLRTRRDAAARIIRDYNKSAILSYPDTVEGLRDFLQTFVEAIKNADLEERSRLEESLRIPELQKWFTFKLRTAGRS